MRSQLTILRRRLLFTPSRTICCRGYHTTFNPKLNEPLDRDDMADIMKGPRIEATSARTLESMPFILNEIFKHQLDWDNREKMYAIVHDVVKEHYPTEPADQVREIEKKVLMVLNEKRDNHRYREHNYHNLVSQ